ncbi:related to tetratricopeptide repeat domain protein-Neosartorya fischeri [Serendipita indica DSM 11827]|uniref:Related to tetratricopeptide repeat domain protein-Neosartorya fischeri n=1 Tax=Serendipita indica (strain DSM 11827) TaxID=1109443 RepID=G4TVL1_SERID|nr:related to tetratricopeptide repeat domain protein-Neosartorya fischeri [Serendipita indica DSM 11827]
MSSFHSRLRNVFRPSQKSSKNTNKSATLDANSNSPRPSTSEPISKADQLDFLELASGTDPIVDIVAIHGLQGHRERTWTTDQGSLWLRDLLPTDLSNARVLTYGYDADARSPECVSTQTMRRHADGFAKALSRKRKVTPRRPIIFVAHDLGGIILKWALVICHNQSLESKCDLRDILISTHAILFFGTPHSGTDVTLLEAVNRLALVYMETTDIILKDLRSNSSELENVQSLYAQASTTIESIFFYGQYTTRGLNVPYHSAVIAGDRHGTPIPLPADHREMVRFTSRNSNSYQTVLHYLQDYVKNAPAEVKKKWDVEDICRNATSVGIISPKPCPPSSRGYIERTHIQSLISQALLPDRPVKDQPRCILHGIGGAGKTQLAINWIGANKDRFTRVIFVDASSQSQVEMDLERSIRCLGPEYTKKTWEDAVAHLDYKDQGWLLFIDNADSPKLDLRPYLPTSTHGKVLITTRNAECINYAPSGAVLVGALEKSEAVDLLHAVAQVAPVSDTQSLAIVEELGMLALAITQAGAYIRQTRRLSAYLGTLRKSRNRLLSRKPDIGSDYTSSAYAAFDLSFHQLPNSTQKFLRLCAFLHHSLIPLSLFELSTMSGFTTYTIRISCPPPESDRNFILKLREIFGETWDEVAFQEIVKSAAQASFINVSTDGAFYSIHPLLQMYIQDSLDAANKGDFVRMALQLLLGAIRPAEGSKASLWHLLPHASRIPRSVLSENLAHIVAFNGLYDDLGNWRACWELLEYSLERVREKQGERHSNTMWVMSRLAEALWCCGQLNEAERMQRKTLALQLEILGRENHDTIRTMHCLAQTLNGRGQLDEAEKMQRDVLALRLEVSGPRHPDTITAMNNLAETLRGRGQLDEAEKMQRDVLALRLEFSGSGHPDTNTVINNLALILDNCGKTEEAERIRQDVRALQLQGSG